MNIPVDIPSLRAWAQTLPPDQIIGGGIRQGLRSRTCPVACYLKDQGAPDPCVSLASITLDQHNYEGWLISEGVEAAEKTGLRMELPLEIARVIRLVDGNPENPTAAQFLAMLDEVEKRAQA